MKKLAFITGALAFALIPIGMLLKTVHWPGAHVFLVIGIGLFSLVFIPSAAKFLYSKEI